MRYLSTKNLGDICDMADAPMAPVCGGRSLWSLTFDDVGYRVRYGVLEICNAGSQRGLIATVEWR